MTDYNSGLEGLLCEYANIWKQLQTQIAKNNNTDNSYRNALKDAEGQGQGENSAMDMQSPNDKPLTENEEFMEILELKFMLKAFKQAVTIQIFSALSKSDTVSSKCTSMDKCLINTNTDTNQRDSSHVMAEEKRGTVDRDQLFQRSNYLAELIDSLDKIIEYRLELTRKCLTCCVPRIVRLCDQYDFNVVERDVFYLLVIVLGSRRQCILNSFLEEEYLRRVTGYQRMGCMSEVDMEIFCNSERQHIKEGMVLVEDDQGVYYNMRVPRTAVQLCYGRTVKADDMLIIAQTCMESVLALEMNTHTMDDAVTSISMKSHRKRVREDAIPFVKRRNIYDDTIDDYCNNNDLESESDPSIHSQEYSNVANAANSDISNINPTTDMSDQDIESNDMYLKDKFEPYPSDTQLEYLEEGFSLIGLLVRSNAVRIKDDMKKEGTRLNNYWDTGEVKQGKRELYAKINILEKKVQYRVKATEDAGIAIPRLEILSQRLHLDSLEKKIILLLIGKIVSPVIRTLIDTLDNSSTRIDDGISVGQALNILCLDFPTQVSNRKYFYKSSRLMTNGIISLGRGRWHQGKGDLTEQRIQLDRRILDWTVGLDSEINELVEGSDLYEPTCYLDQLVLPSGHLDMLLVLCKSYTYFLQHRENDALMMDKMSYGNSLVVLLCGKPGTGKTMTVNAIAKHLGKKVLLVDFGALNGRQSDISNAEVDLRGLFREASMNNAIIFFDECESIFKSRVNGGDKMLNTMLTEIERYSGLVFLATNMAYELDEAMHRRITCVIEYRSPDHNMRKKIWENLLGMNDTQEHKDAKSIVTEHMNVNTALILKSDNSNDKNNAEMYKRFKLDKDVDIESIAVKYELTGGFIKNAVLSALLCALDRNPLEPTISQHDLISGCKLQMRGSLIQRTFEDKTEAYRGLNELCLHSDIRKSCERILRFEKARERMYAGTRDGLKQRACLVTLVGPSGSGKLTMASSIAFDLNRTIKLLHVADILSMNISETLKAVRIVLQDARLADAVFVLDGFEHILDENSGTDNTFKLHLLLSRLLDLLEQYPGLVILVSHVDTPQHLSLQRDFASKLFECIRCVYPTNDVRIKLWNQLMPKSISVSADVSYTDLGRRFELYPSSIAAAITRAIAEASMQEDTSSSVKGLVRQKDLVAAAEAEIEKMKSGNFELISKLFT